MPTEMKPLKLFSRCAPAVFALGAGFFLMPAGRAQPSPQTADNRYLFIFDTSADMKTRLPAVQAEVDQLLATSMGGQLHAGDSLGVWTFDRDLRTGQFPLQRWMPEDAVTIASSINKLVGKQHYANGTRFNSLQPQLNEVIRNSGRLTVLIFCGIYRQGLLSDVAPCAKGLFPRPDSVSAAAYRHRLQVSRDDCLS